MGQIAGTQSSSFSLADMEHFSVSVNIHDLVKIERDYGLVSGAGRRLGHGKAGEAEKQSGHC